jgi:hypothetical protein
MQGLTEQQLRRLVWLADNGGDGYLDSYGRVCAQGQTCHQGAFPAWLGLFAKGYLIGSDGRIRLTDMGRAALPRRGLPTGFTEAA